MGDFKNGLKHGKGKWRKDINEASSNSYEGEYQYDKKHGFGVFSWHSGNQYKGNYYEDERHGYGEMYWIDGSVYKGNWVKGIQDGQGILIMSDGRVKEGQFENNIFKGSQEVIEEEEEEPRGNKYYQINVKNQRKLQNYTNLDKKKIKLPDIQSIDTQRHSSFNLMKKNTNNHEDSYIMSSEIDHSLVSKRDM